MVMKTRRSRALPTSRSLIISRRSSLESGVLRVGLKLYVEVQFEELDEKPKGRQVGEVTKDWVGKTIFSMYANFSAKRTLALRLFKVLYLLSNNLEEEEAPFYIVPYFTSPRTQTQRSQNHRLQNFL
jgi:hypothetical protein